MASAAWPSSITSSVATIAPRNGPTSPSKQSIMTTIKGPAVFLAQFLGDQPPFNSLAAICKWAAGLGYIGVQLPSWDSRVIDLQKAAESKTYADEIKGIVSDPGRQITEPSFPLKGSV